MPESFEISLWVERIRSDALLRQLEKENITLELKMLECFDRLYEQYVPGEEKEMIAEALEKERQESRREQEARRRFAIFRVTEDGRQQTFMSEPGPDMLMAAWRLREYLREGGRSFAESCASRTAIGPEVFEGYARERLDNTGRVIGAFEIDLDKGTFAALHIMDGWQVFKVKDVCSAAYHATKKGNMSWDGRWERFLEKLDGKALTRDDEVKTLTGSRRLRPGEISFEGEAVEVGSRLNFYVPVRFDPDEVFGLNVAAAENDDYINVYANYDLESGEVCDHLEVILYTGEDVVEYKYPITEEEKEMLHQKMDAHCLADAGRPLSELRQQYRQEQGAAPTEMKM